MIELRAYQRDVIGEIEHAVASGKKRVLLVAPTGSGKTVIAAEVSRRGVASGKRVLVLAHRRELVVQAGQRLFEHGINSGTIQAGIPMRLGEPVQVASIQTLWARAIRGSAIELPAADLVIVDEAHHARAETYRKIIAAYPPAVILGLTATPCRSDGRGLGNAFDTLIECPQVPELIALGHLVPTRVFAPSIPDLRGVQVERGDYVEKQLASAMNNVKLVGDVVTHWHRHAERRRTVAFAVDVAHSVHIRDEFLKSGVRAAHIDGGTPKDERDAILKRLSTGEIELVSNCMVLTEGWDCPEVSCAILARPTKHTGLFRQMIGRVLRPAPVKADAIILDHAGAVFEHGFAEDEIKWTLDSDRRAENKKHAARKAVGSRSRLATCPKCDAMRLAGEGCSACGWQPARRPRSVEFRDGDLGAVDRRRQVQQHKHSQAERARWHAELAGIARARNFKPGWAAHQFKERFGAWPPFGPVAPAEPSPEVLSWVRSRMIAYAKARRSA